MIGVYEVEIYFDNSATTRCLEEVKDIVVKTMMEDYGNPSSLHLMGVQAEKYIKESKRTISQILKVEEKEIYFTSGGTEANNLALIGAAMANRRRGMHLITTAIEHSSVSSTMKYLEEQGFLVSYLGVDNNGFISLKELEEAIREDTILVSIMYVNNEIGSVQPVEQISSLIKKKNPGIVFHVDAVQAFGKYRIYPKKQNIDLLSVSGHKIHGPKGIGFLYINEKVKVKPILYGGGHQRNMRSGTENVPGTAGIGVAAQKCYENFDAKIAHLQEIKRAFMDGIRAIENTIINGSIEESSSAPYIVSVSFLGVRSEVLLHALEDRHIYVSAGSACSSNKKSPVSATLKAIGLAPEQAESTLRFSFSADSTIEEVSYCLETLKEILPKLRIYRRQ